MMVFNKSSARTTTPEPPGVPYESDGKVRQMQFGSRSLSMISTFKWFVEAV